MNWRAIVGASMRCEVSEDGALITWPDGREQCTDTPQGWALYNERIRQMVERQHNICCLCSGWLRTVEATFEHEDGRGIGGAHRDDRIWKDDKPYNGAAHKMCNSKKGSKRGGYIHSVVPNDMASGGSVSACPLVDWAESTISFHGRGSPGESEGSSEAPGRRIGSDNAQRISPEHRSPRLSLPASESTHGRGDRIRFRPRDHAGDCKTGDGRPELGFRIRVG